MPQIEVYEGEDDQPLFTSEFAFAPRVGEYISREMGGYFTYYDVIEAWHRDEVGSFVACVRVKLRD